jgi:hypothetical protein
MGLAGAAEALTRSIMPGLLAVRMGEGFHWRVRLAS